MTTLSILFCASLIAAAAPAPPDARTLTRAVDAYVKPLTDADQLSGQLVISRGGAILVERAYGFADAARRERVTADTRFNVASVTKPMTTALAFALMAEKRIGYRDPLTKWIRDFPAADSITVELLMRHRAGVTHEVFPDTAWPRGPLTAEEVVNEARKRPLDFAPGAKSSYSSGGFSVLARVLELASGRSYAELLDERLFLRLGMTRSSHGEGAPPLPPTAISFAPGLHGIAPLPRRDYTPLVGAGSVSSTARDLHRFVRAVVRDTLGVELRQSFLRDGRLHFNGRTNGFLAWAVYDSASDVAVVWAGNLHTGGPELLKDAMPRLAKGETMAPPSVPVAGPALPEAALRRFEGVYQIENGPRIELRVKDGALWANDWMLAAARGGGFFSPRDYGLVKPVDGPDGAVSRLDWTVGGQTYPAPRVGGR